MSLRMIVVRLAIIIVSISALVFQVAQGSNDDNDNNTQEARVRHKHLLQKCSFRVISWTVSRTVFGTCGKKGCCASLSWSNDTEKICLGFCFSPQQAGTCPEKCRNTGIKSLAKFHPEADQDPEAENGRCFPVENGRKSGCACGVAYQDLDIRPQTICLPIP